MVIIIFNVIKMSEMVKIDKLGRLLIPKKIRESWGIAGDMKAILEKKGDSIMITPAHRKVKDISKRIAAMNLPIDEWEKVEEEIEKGAISE